MYCCRLDSTTWYVWEKEAFSKGNTSGIIPKYINVYKVQCNRMYTECWCDKSCKILSRSGIPCEHIFKVFNVCHPKMIHPRYLKVYNDDNMYSNHEIQNILSKMIQWKRDNPRKCNIDGLLQPNVTEDFDIKSSVLDTMMPEILSVIAAHKMDTDEKVLVSGDDIPCQYIEFAKEYLEEKVHGNIEVDSISLNGYDLSFGDNNNTNNDEDRNGDNDDSNNDEDRYSYSKMNTFMDTCKKELDKVLKGDPHSWHLVKKDILNAISCQTIRLNTLQNNPTSSTHTIVSSNGPTERSPNGKRYRSFYERK